MTVTMMMDRYIECREIGGVCVCLMNGWRLTRIVEGGEAMGIGGKIGVWHARIVCQGWHRGRNFAYFYRVWIGAACIVTLHPVVIGGQSAQFWKERSSCAVNIPAEATDAPTSYSHYR
jgi:hypothetical protein